MITQHDDAHLWQIPIFGGLELLRADLVELQFAPHTHEEFMIAVTEAGTAAPRFWGAVQWLGRGDLFVLSPGEVHAGGPAADSAWRYRAFYPPTALLRRAAQELTGVDRGVPQFAAELIRDPKVGNLLWQAHRALEQPGPLLERESRLLEALTALIARHATGTGPAQRIGSEHQAVQRAKEVLEASAGMNISLDLLAREAGLSAFHLCRVFRRTTGLSPHAYQTLVRTRRAKALLAAGLSLAQAAADAGFFDQAHLTRHFKRIYGVTPGRYQGGV